MGVGKWSSSNFQGYFFIMHRTDEEYFVYYFFLIFMIKQAVIVTAAKPKSWSYQPDRPGETFQRKQH